MRPGFGDVEIGVLYFTPMGDAMRGDASHCRDPSSPVAIAAFSTLF
jgi:hypothetical protein